LAADGDSADRRVRILRGVVIQGSGTRHSDRRRGPGQQHPLPQSDADDRRDAYGLGRLRRTGNGRGRTTDASGQGHGNRSDSRFLRKEHSQQQPDPSGKLPDRHEHYGKRSAGEGFANDCHHFYRRYPAATADETRADRKTGYGATDARTVRQTCAIQPAYQLRLLPFTEFHADDASDLHDHGDDFRHRNRTQERHGQGVVRHGRRFGLRGLRGQNPADYGHYVPDVGIDAPGHLQGGRRAAERQPDGHHHQQSAFHPELPVPRRDDRHRVEQSATVALARRRLFGAGLHVLGPYVPDHGNEQTHAMVLLHLSVHILHRYHGRSGPARSSGDIFVARHGHHRPVHHSSAAMPAASAHHLHG